MSLFGEGYQPYQPSENPTERHTSEPSPDQLQRIWSNITMDFDDAGRVVRSEAFYGK